MPPSPSASRNRYAAIVAVVTATAVGIRLLVAWRMSFQVPVMGDASTYHLVGSILADGHGYLRPRDWLTLGIAIPSAEFPPLFPLLLALLDRLGIDTIEGQRLVVAAIGGLLPLPTAALARRVMRRPLGPARAQTIAVIAAVVVALSPWAWLLDASLLTEPVGTLLFTTACAAVVAAVQDGGNRRWLVAGALTGLCGVARTELAVAAAVMMGVALLVSWRRQHGPSGALRLGTAVGAVLLLVAPISAWTARNAVTLGTVQPFTNNSGTLLAGANCPPVYSGSMRGLWRFDCVISIDTSGMTESGAAARWRSEGIAFARAHASELPGLAAVRLGRTLGVWEVRNQIAFERHEGRPEYWARRAWAVWIATATVALAGLAVGARRRQLHPVMLVAPFTVVVVSVFGYGNQRFRSVADPVVAVLVALAAEAVWRLVRLHFAGRDHGDPTVVVVDPVDQRVGPEAALPVVVT